MEDVADVLLGAGLVGRRPAAVDPAAFEQERQLAVAQLFAHRRPRLCRGQDLLGAEAVIGLLVVGHHLAGRGAVTDPLPARVLELTTVRPQQWDEGMVGRAAGAGRAGVQRVRKHVRFLGVLHRVRGIEDALDVRGLPVRRQTGLLEVVLAVVQPAHVEAVGDRPDAALVRHAALDGVGVLAPVGPLADVLVERLDVARLGELPGGAAADVEHIRSRAAIQRQQQLRVVVVVADLLEVDLDVDAGELRLDRGRGLLDVLRLQPGLVRVGHVDRAADRAAARGRTATASGCRAATAPSAGACGWTRAPNGRWAARRRNGGDCAEVQEPPTRDDLPDDLVPLHPPRRTAGGVPAGDVELRSEGHPRTSSIELRASTLIGPRSRNAARLRPFWPDPGAASEDAAYAVAKARLSSRAWPPRSAQIQ